MQKTFGITLFIAFANAISFTILIPILYLYGREFGLTDFQTSLLFAVYAAAQFFATPVIGKLSDRYGRKPLLIVSLIGTVIANALAFSAGLVNIAGLLFFARFLDGITGGNVSVVQAVIADITPVENRAKSFGLFGAVTFGLGFTLGPALSLLTQQYSLGAGFLVSSVIAAIALILTIFGLPETLKQSTQVAPRRLFDLGLGNLISGLKLPRLGLLFIINFLIGTTFTIFTFGFQPYFLELLGQTNQALTALFIVFGLISALVQAKGLAILNKRFSLSMVLFLGLLMRGLTFVLMPLYPNVIYFVCISIAFSVFNSLVQPTIITLISLNAKPEVQGMALGLNASYLNVSNAFGPMIAGLIVDRAYPETYRYPLVLAGMLTLGVLAFAILKRDRYDVARSPRS
ncbi:MFS transporter [filamentous cyanobacterium LEGE 11480]|uniref:MFS transporter n=1 Tax=Romeriopsis navalis LEGE 11480 TaxID=2777977 RepID=A0A928VTW7_9CYAN|nr:MFS transporter [Romeriopsis navalis]MBE9032515.1 MFS transporter [Romeriopsis navalis LEGE 11480]